MKMASSLYDDKDVRDDVTDKDLGDMFDARDRLLSQEELSVAHGSLKTLSFARGLLN